MLDVPHREVETHTERDRLEHVGAALDLIGLAYRRSITTFGSQAYAIVRLDGRWEAGQGERKGVERGEQVGRVKPDESSLGTHL